MRDERPLFTALAICQRLVRATGPMVAPERLQQAKADAYEAAAALTTFGDSIEAVAAPQKIRAVK